MTRFPIDGTGRLSSEREHPTADLVGPAGGELAGSYPNPTVARGWLPTRNLEASNGVDDTADIQAAIDSLPSRGGTLACRHGEVYSVTDAALTLPQTGSGTRPTFTIEGNGALLQVPASNTTKTSAILTDIVPADQTAAMTQGQRKLVIRGLGFDGSLGGAGWLPGLALMCSEDSHIEDCIGIALSTAFEFDFCLGAQVNNCEAINCNGIGFLARAANGLWSGATTSNSGSNQTAFKSCRNYARGGMTAGFRIYASDGVDIDNCTTEGGNPVANVVFESANDATVKQFFLRNLHAENTPSGADLVANAAGRVIVDGLYAQTSHILIDASGSYSNSAVIDVRNLPWIPAGATLKCNPAAGGELWLFAPCGAQGTFDPTNTANWNGATIPANIYGWRNDSGGAYGFFTGTGTKALELKSHLWAVTDDTYDIGFSGSQRFRKAFMSGGVGQFGHAPPSSQPVTPTNITDVIALLQSYGMCA